MAGKLRTSRQQSWSPRSTGAGRTVSVWRRRRLEWRTPKERRPVGGNRAPAFQKRLGKSGAVGETGPFSERTVALSASEATIAGREPSKGRFGNYSDPQPEICLGRDALCTICWRDGSDPVGPDPSLPGTGTYSSLR